MTVHMPAARRLLERAVALASTSVELDSDHLTHSLVDDAFYILLKGFHRSVRTGAATLAVIPLLNTLADAIRVRLWQQRV